MTYKKRNAKKIAFCAVFASLCCLSTLFIKVPVAYGYFNVGDVFVLLAGWMMGGVWGGIAAGVGSALSDVIGGYAIYAPITLLIKALMPAIAYYLHKALKKLIKKDVLDFLPRLISGLAAELLMVVGYFVFDSLVYGISAGVTTITANLMQGGVCLVGAVALVEALSAIPFIKKTFLQAQ